jgi:hypothetical protein
MLCACGRICEKNVVWTSAGPDAGAGVCVHVSGAFVAAAVGVLVGEVVGVAVGAIVGVAVDEGLAVGSGAPCESTNDAVGAATMLDGRLNALMVIVDPLTVACATLTHRFPSHKPSVTAPAGTADVSVNVPPKLLSVALDADVVTVT